MQGKAKLTLHELINVALKAKEAGIKLSAYFGSVHVTAADLVQHVCELQYIDFKLRKMIIYCNDMVAAIGPVNSKDAAQTELRGRMFDVVSQADRQTKALQAAVSEILKYAKCDERRS